MHICFDGKPVTAGDPGSVATIFNNLSGANFEDKARWIGYVRMMNAEFFSEKPLSTWMRVDLVCHDTVYATFKYLSGESSGVTQDDIARVYQQNQPKRVFTEEIERSIYEEACTWDEEGQTLSNPFCPHTEFRKFQAFAWAQFRVLTGQGYLNVRKLHAAAQDEQERALYTSICEMSPWYGDERIGPRLREDLFLEPSPF